MLLRCRNLESVEYPQLPQLWMPFLKVPTSQLTSNTLEPKWVINKLSTSLVLAMFMAALPSNFRSCNLPHMCAIENLKGLLHLDTRSESSFLSDGFRNRKNAPCKTKSFHKHESWLCHKHAVNMLTQAGHADEQLKEWLKSQKEENRNCLLKIVQSISYISWKRHCSS